MRQLIVTNLQQNQKLVALVKSNEYLFNEREIALCGLSAQTAGGITSTGKYIVDALRELFGMEFVRVQDAHGFVVHHEKRETEYLRWKRNGVTGIEYNDKTWPQDDPTPDEMLASEYGWQSNKVFDPDLGKTEGVKEGNEWHFVWENGAWTTWVDFERRRLAAMAAGRAWKT